MARSLLGAALILTLGGIAWVKLNGITMSSPPVAKPAPYPTCLRSWQFDRQIRSQADQAMDDRLLIVSITEADMQQLGRWPFSDQTYADLLTELQRHQPAVIGLSIFKDIAIPPGSAALEKQLQRSSVILAVLLKEDYSSYAVPPRSGVPEQRTGFVNLMVDRDGVVRRNLIFAPDPQLFQSFSWQLATHYLKRQNIVPQVSRRDAQILQLGAMVLPPLRRSCAETAPTLTGYQIPLYYRTSGPIARQVTFTQVLKKQVTPAWVKDKVVIIGVADPTFHDLANTPYADPKGDRGRRRMYGVELQAQMVSQLLSATLGF